MQEEEKQQKNKKTKKAQVYSIKILYASGYAYHRHRAYRSDDGARVSAKLINRIENGTGLREIRTKCQIAHLQRESLFCMHL